MVPFFPALLIIAALFCPCAQAGAALPGPYPAEVVRVLDGDSFEARIRIWLDQDVVTIVRLAGIDTAELDAPCDAARARAAAARDFLSERLKAGVVSLSDIRRDKFGGRVVARATAGGADVASALAEAGLAQPYRGRRPDWCALAAAPAAP